LRQTLIILVFFISYSLQAQTLGGTAVYNFLHLPSSPLLSAAGGVNTSLPSTDVGMASNNPALLREELHTQTAASFNAYFAGTKAYHLSGAYHLTSAGVTLGSSIFYIDYGALQQTTETGEIQGTFRPRDFSFQLSAAKSYLENWNYGGSIKFINSNYGQYRSSGIAFDAGVLFHDSSKRFTASVLAKNMGVQVSSYNAEKEDLPFDLQIGVTKRLAQAPFGFSVTAQQLHRFNLVYNDTAYNIDNGFESNNSFSTKIFNHLVLATHVYIGNNLEATIGYNRLRRTELNLGSTANGLNGFSGGIKIKFQKLQLQYARSYFGRGAAYNQFGIGMQLNKFFGNNAL
jgi:hypothetical protein